MMHLLFVAMFSLLMVAMILCLIGLIGMIVWAFVKAIRGEL